MSELSITDNTNAKRYEMPVKNGMAYIEYIKAQDKIYLTHTEVARSAEGQGIGSKLIGLVLKDIDKQKLTLIPLCPFVVHFLKEHPEWTKLVMKGINLED